MTLEDGLPERLRSASISRIKHGLSGAGVYRVEANGERYVLKVSAAGEPLEAWRAQLVLQQRVAEAGVAPRVIHHDEARRSVVSEFIADRGFLARMGNPQTRGAAIETLGQMLRRVHSIPLPEDSTWADPREKFVPQWNALADFAVPMFAREAIDRVLAEAPPARERPLVLSHNDPNPSNLVFDGERLLLIDWNSAGPNDPFFDLAALALFLRFDDATASVLVGACDGATPAPLTPYFRYARRLIAAVCAVMAFSLARRSGHHGGELRAEEAPTLLAVQGALGAGTLRLSSPEGAWSFALALVRAIDA